MPMPFESDKAVLQKRFTELSAKINLFTAKRDKSADKILQTNKEIALYDKKLSQLSKEFVAVASELSRIK